MVRATLALATALAAACLPAGLGLSQPADDRLIVPNERAGRLRLGMPAAEVVSTFGQPQSSGFFGSSGSGKGYLSYRDGGGRQTISASTWGSRNEYFVVCANHE